MFVTERWGLRGRSIALCLILILGAVLVIVTALSWRARQQAVGNLVMHAETYAQALSHNAEPAVLLDDPEALQRVVESAGHDEALIQAEILSPIGKRLSSLARGQDGDTNPTEQLHNELTLTQTAQHLLVTAPIWRATPEMDLGLEETEDVQPDNLKQAPIGYVALTYSLGAIHAETARQLSAAAMLGLLVIAAGIGLTLFAVSHILRPLRDLVRTTTQIANGARGERVSERAVGEIGDLARSFNMMAESLEASYRDIERKVEQRTAELNDKRIELEHEIAERRQIEDKLREAKEAAEAGSRAKSEFLANISHEIRTPMNGIIGMTELLSSTALNEEQEEYLRTARSCSDALLALLNDVLDFSKIEAGKMDLDHSDFTIETLIESAVDLIGQGGIDKGIGVYCEIEAGTPPRAVGDASRLRQILVNLAGNAIKFTAEGHVLLRVGLAENGNVRFAVEDTGIGIAPERQSQIFDSFTQADGATTRKYGGTGLGLAITRQLVELMGGTIGVESEPNEGSTFWVEVPLEIADPDETSEEAVLTNRTVALLAPNDRGREALQTLCERWGGSVRVAAALPDNNWYQECDVIVVDASLVDPTDPRYTRLPAPIILGHTKSAVAATVLPKPWKPSVLRQALASDARTTRSTSPAKPAPPAAAPTPPTARSTTGTAILLVEDNTVNQQVARGILEQRGCTVTVADNGKIALERLAEKTYDLILMDVQMPEMDGFETTRQIRANSNCPDIPIIAMTAHAMKGDRDACLAAGMNDYLTKPFQVQELEGLIRKWKPQPEPVNIIEPPSGGSTLDVDRALGLLGGDEDLLQEVLSVFIGNLPNVMDDLSTAMNEADGQRLALAALTFSDAAEHVGADAVRSAALTLEQLAREGNLESVPEQLARLQEELSAVRREAGNLLGEGGQA